MIHNDKELKATQQRIAYFQDLLLQLKAKATPEEFPLISSGYRTEIQKMQDEVLEYLMDHTKISQADSIQELAHFWYTRDLINFEDEPEELMEEDKFEKYLKERYEPEVNRYNNRASRNKRCYQWFQWAAIIISVSVLVMVVSMPDELKWITVALLIVLPIATAALITFKFQENWINYKTIAEILKKEKYYYDAETIEYATAKDKKRLFMERVETLNIKAKYIVEGGSEESKEEAQKG